jgi:crotonobetainyl-CoA:carnitine CoA-transferase CaiB-like acyl-CoA transferase
MDLQGLVVLDLSRVLAGPYATQVLADLGATVWKVEPPRGDDTRGWGPPFAAPRAATEEASAAPELRSAYFLSVNRHKRSVCIDLKAPGGPDLVRRLAARADVVIDNFKVGDLARYGLDAASLRAASPRLVTCSITGFGANGPRSAEPGYDAAVQALAGVMAMTGEPGGSPVKLGVAWVDVLTGLHAAVGILAALRARDATGVGRHLDVALFDVALASLVNQGQAALLTGAAPARLGSAHPSIVPYQAFAAADAPLTVACGNDAQFARLAAVLGAPEWAADPRFATNAARVVHRDVLVPLVAARFATDVRDAWVARCVAAGVPATPVLDVVEALHDPQVAARGMVGMVDDPIAGPIPMVASPFGAAARPLAPAPLLGGDTADVLRDALGIEDAALAALEADGVVRTAAASGATTDRAAGAEAAARTVR